MTTKQQQLAEFLRTHGFSPPPSYHDFWFYSDPVRPLSWRHYASPPTVVDLATELLDTTGFRALQLANWLGATEGAVIMEAVQMVIPPIYRADIKLLVEALKLAARFQQREGQRVAGRLAALALAGTVGVALFMTGSLKRR